MERVESCRATSQADSEGRERAIFRLWMPVQYRPTYGNSGTAKGDTEEEHGFPLRSASTQYRWFPEQYARTHLASFQVTLHVHHFRD